MFKSSGRICSAFLVIVASSAVNAEYRRIGDGPPLKYAQAYCDNLSMGVDEDISLPVIQTLSAAMR